MQWTVDALRTDDGLRALVANVEMHPRTLGLAMGLGWFIYHPAWDRATLWGFEQHFNASRVLLADVGIAVVVLVSWIVRVSLRARKRLQERNLQSGRVPRA